MASASGDGRPLVMEATLTMGGYNLLCEGRRRLGDPAVVIPVCKILPIPKDHPRHERAVARLVVTDRKHVGAAFLLRSAGYTLQWNPNKEPEEELVFMTDNEVMPFVPPLAVMHVRSSLRITQAHPVPSIVEWESGSQAYMSSAHTNSGLIPVMPPAAAPFNNHLFAIIAEMASNVDVHNDTNAW